MSTVGAREANRSFSKILKEAENGKTVTITRNGKPIARLSPVAAPALTGKAREKAIERMVAMMKNSGLHFGGGPYSREDMHKR